MPVGPRVTRAAILALALSAASSALAGLRLEADAPVWTVGFDRPATVRVEAAGSDGPVTYRWRQVSGPSDVPVDGLRGSELRFRTAGLGGLLSLDDRPGVVAVPAWAAEPYRFEVTARAGGESVTGVVSVRAGHPSPGASGVAVDTDVTIAGPGDQTAWLWEVETRNWDVDASVAVRGQDQRLVTVHPYLTDEVTVRERLSGWELTLHVGTWDGFEDCGRCHTPEHRLWQGTKHATVLQRGLLGRMGNDYRESCLGCHTAGWQIGTASGGFDDIARWTGWAFPKARGPAAAQLPDHLARLSGVHCLSCHGPGRFTPSTWDEGTCAGCHDLPPRYTTVREWRASPMGRFQTPLTEDHPAVTPGCTRCHSARGFARWRAGVDDPDPPLLSEAEPITCVGCHDPHDGRRPHQLRAWGSVQTLSGAALDDAGAGALCATCHNLGVPETDRRAHPGRHAPLAPQADVFAGTLGMADQPAESVHAGLRGTCVACHAPHLFVAGRDCRGETCAGSGCHDGADCGDVGRELDATAEALAARLPGRLEHARDRQTLVRPDGRVEQVEAWLADLPAAQAAALAEGIELLEAYRRDGSRGAHNPAWARQALERAAQLLEDGGLPAP